MPVEVAEWGSPSTPLLPSRFIEALAEQPLPDSLRAAGPELKTFSDLPRYWELIDEPLSRIQRRELVASAQKVPKMAEIEALPAWVSEAEVLALPVSVRTSNAIRHDGLLPSPYPVTVGRLLDIANFGITSLVDLLCVLEAAGLVVGGGTCAGEPQRASEIDQHVSEIDQHVSEIDSGPDMTAGWAGADMFVDSVLRILSLARDVLGCRSVADALASPRLVELLDKTGAAETLQGLGLDELPGDVGPVAGLIDAVRLVEVEHGPDNIEILLRHKVHRSDSLASLGDERGVTHERVRQLEVKVAAALGEHGGAHASLIASVVRGPMAEIVRNDLVEGRIDAVLRSFASASGDQSETSTKTLCRYLIRSRLGYTTKGSFALSDDGRHLVDTLAQRIISEADDVGLVDLKAILAQEAPHALPFVDELVELLGLTRIGVHLALRDTRRVRAKLALLEIGRSATKEEIAEQGGFDAERLTGTLSGIDSIARADKSRWGLIEWIDDVYEGIPAEIRQRIDEHGGFVSLSFLLEDIAERFGVSEASVRTYAATKQFDVTDGMVSVANPHTLNYRSIDDVATRNEHGELCWEFLVEDRYFNGYSINRFPPELARELGCGPNDRGTVPVASPDGCNPVSINWRLTAPSGDAEIGRVSDALQRIDVVAGEFARVVIVNDGSAVRFESVTKNEPPAESPTAGDLLERLKSRRRID